MGSRADIVLVTGCRWAVDFCHSAQRFHRSARSAGEIPVLLAKVECNVENCASVDFLYAVCVLDPRAEFECIAASLSCLQRSPCCILKQLRIRTHWGRAICMFLFCCLWWQNKLLFCGTRFAAFGMAVLCDRRFLSEGLDCTNPYYNLGKRRDNGQDPSYQHGCRGRAQYQY